MILSIVLPLAYTLPLQRIPDNPGGGGAANAKAEEGAKIAGGRLAGEVEARDAGLELVVQRRKALFHPQRPDDGWNPANRFAGQFNR